MQANNERLILTLNPERGLTFTQSAMFPLRIIHLAIPNADLT